MTTSERADDAGVVEALLDEAGLAVAVTTLDGRTVTLNDTASDVFPEPWPLTAERGLDRLRPLLDQAPGDLLTRSDGGMWRGEAVLPRGDDVPRTYDAVVVVHRPGPVGHGFIGVVCRDVAEDRRRVDELVDRLEHDPVTGLLHRQAVIRRAASRLHRDDAGPGRVAALVIDVDRMHDINQSLGHDVGDQLLTASARRLEQTIDVDNLIGRLGGDEFVVICFGLAGESEAVDVADRLRRALSGRLLERGHELDVSVSVGISLADPSDSEPTHAEKIATRLVSEADTAVQAAKRSGRARVAVFTDELHRQATARSELSVALVKGLRTGELDLEFQPIFSAVSEHGEGAEALVRWNHPSRGRLDAGSFIAVAEHTGVIVPIGEWVIDRSCEALRGWIDEGRVDRRFAIHVNVSQIQLSSPGFVERVDAIVRRHELRPRQLVLEARETMMVDDEDDTTVQSIRALRDLGVRVAIDNFGTGSKALSLLTDVGADVLKLDGSLALPSGASDADTRVVRALVMLAHALDMQVVAERVTSVEQLRRLRAAGCDLVQGHLLGRPGPADELLTRSTL
ncbi:MAG: putative bifunctional diguanylate cyclase/phosphodiesterase [Ilumatobacteraceae bacterium]